MIDWNYIVSQIATVAFDILYFGAIISTIVIIILDNRNPVKTMAWILILLFLPIVGLVFYFFFGRSQRRRNTWRRTVPIFPMNTPVSSSFFVIPIRLFLSKGTGCLSIRKATPSYRHYCANFRRRNSISTWNIISLRMTPLVVW